MSEYSDLVDEMVRLGIPRYAAERAARTHCEQLGIEAPAAAEITMSPEQLRDREERLEKTIEHEGDKQMQALGFTVVKFSHPGKTKQTPGIPDRKYYHTGRGITFWWEAKSATGVQRPDQKYFQEMCEACGEIYVLGTDDDLFTWLVENGIARRGPDGLLESLPLEQELQIA